jgi:hypothetical protein
VRQRSRRAVLEAEGAGQAECCIAKLNSCVVGPGEKVNTAHHGAGGDCGFRDIDAVSYGAERLESIIAERSIASKAEGCLEQTAGIHGKPRQCGIKFGACGAGMFREIRHAALRDGTLCFLDSIERSEHRSQTRRIGRRPIARFRGSIAQ